MSNLRQPVENVFPLTDDMKAFVHRQTQTKLNMASSTSSCGGSLFIGETYHCIGGAKVFKVFSRKARPLPWFGMI